MHHECALVFDWGCGDCAGATAHRRCCARCCRPAVLRGSAGGSERRGRGLIAGFLQPRSPAGWRRWLMRRLRCPRLRARQAFARWAEEVDRARRRRPGCGCCGCRRRQRPSRREWTDKRRDKNGDGGPYLVERASSIASKRGQREALAERSVCAPRDTFPGVDKAQRMPWSCRDQRYAGAHRAPRVIAGGAAEAAIQCHPPPTGLCYHPAPVCVTRSAAEHQADRNVCGPARRR
jgi:hypothetical protein